MSAEYGWNHFTKHEAGRVDEADFIDKVDRMPCGRTLRTTLKQISLDDMRQALALVSRRKRFVYNCHANVLRVSRHR